MEVRESKKEPEGEEKKLELETEPEPSLPEPEPPLPEPDEQKREQEFRLMMEKLNSTLRTEKKEEEIVSVLCFVISSHV